MTLPRTSDVSRAWLLDVMEDWRAVYDVVPTDREVGVDEVRALVVWQRSRGELARVLRAMRDDGLLAGGRGRFRRIPLDGADP